MTQNNDDYRQLAIEGMISDISDLASKHEFSFNDTPSRIYDIREFLIDTFNQICDDMKIERNYTIRGEVNEAGNVIKFTIQTSDPDMKHAIEHMADLIYETPDHTEKENDRI